MPEDKKAVKGAHNIIMENRNKISISGVREIDSFDEQTVILLTDYGNLTIKGENLHVSALSVETGELSADGEISSVVYSQPGYKTAGFFARIFK